MYGVWTCAVPSDVIEDVRYESMVMTTIALSDSLHASLSFKTAVDGADDLRRTIVAEQLTGAGWNEGYSTTP